MHSMKPNEDRYILLHDQSPLASHSVRHNHLQSLKLFVDSGSYPAVTVQPSFLSLPEVKDLLPDLSSIHSYRQIHRLIAEKQMVKR